MTNDSNGRQILHEGTHHSLFSACYALLTRATWRRREKPLSETLNDAEATSRTGGIDVDANLSLDEGRDIVPNTNLEDILLSQFKSTR